MSQPPRQGFRFEFGGASLTSVPDALPPTKYASALNVRSYSPFSVRRRPGYTVAYSTANNNTITDIQSFTAIETDNQPRFLAHDRAGAIWLDGNNNTGVNVGNMAAPQGYGASMLPWRPAQSPETWIYVATEGDYQKFSAPDANNNVTQYKVGIAEPQVQLEAAPQAPQFTSFTSNAAGWTPSGTAGATSNSTVFTDTAGTPIADPVIATRLSVPVTIPYYLVGSLVLVNAATTMEVQDFIPPIATCSIVAIRYASGSTGACVIVVGQLPIGEGPTTATILGSLRRGAIVTLSSGSENVLVLSVTTGPNGAVQFECSTSGTHAAAETITGVRVIVVDGSVSNGQAIALPSVNSTITAGTGILTQTLGTNPFAVQLASSGASPTPDDYVRVVILANNIAALQQLQIIFTCNTYGTFTYTANALENLEAGELAIVSFPISALVPSGSNISLASCTSVQVSVLTSGTQAFSLSSFCISGGGLPDIGNDGAPYQYRFIGRNTTTGAQGNPSPVMRYGVSPRRQKVTVPLPAVAAAFPAVNSQINIYDVYRYGGSVFSYRYIGSGAPGTIFTDQYFDDTARADNVMPTQQYEPWPSVDIPFKITSGITVTGSQIVMASLATVPGTILRWLPGTLIQIGGQDAYTLRRRPQLISGTTYLLDLIESAGSLSPSLLTISEPLVARQMNQYMWGPDVNGYFFAVGDELRPGVISFPTPNQPDMTASTNTNEPTNPSEPLLNGAIRSGLSYVASSARWWAMYPAFDTATGRVFQPFQVDVGRGLAAPRGIATDNINIFFWAKDGICSHGGGAFTSLTDADLYPLFPHEDVQGVNVTRNGVTYYAPDYSRAATFRLAHVNGFLYADYQDSDGTPRSLVCQLKSGAWSQDSYADPVTCRCALAQPAGTLSSLTETYDLAVMGTNGGKVLSPSLTAGDNGAAISVVLGTFEWDGEPFRNGGIFQDFYLDCLPVSGITATLVQFGAQAVTPTAIGASADRILVMIDAGVGTLARFLGLKLAWSDEPGDVTVLYTWRCFADPDVVYSWNTKTITFGLTGYIHCGRIEPAYSSTDTVTLNLTTYDGTSAATMTLPSTGGDVQKVLVTPTVNKGQLYSFAATSAAPFQIYDQDSILWVKQWGSSSGYLPYRLALQSSVKP